ncbi:type 4a pilus biogenesis protein PilO, partial [Pseudomonadales bacterium]|nr:type 4a pilus biogenesis protein PilO [Pseudomonadales bacterium]
GSFVSDVADLSRIVTLHDFSMSPVRSRKAQQNVEVTGGLIQMSITAKTYRYNDARG